MGYPEQIWDGISQTMKSCLKKDLHIQAVSIPIKYHGEYHLVVKFATLKTVQHVTRHQ